MNELVKIENNQIIVATEVVEQFKNFKKIKDEMDLKEKEFKQQLKDAMSKIGIKSWSFCGIYVEIKHVSGKITIDSKKLKEELPDIYQEYSKMSDPYDSINLKITE